MSKRFSLLPIRHGLPRFGKTSIRTQLLRLVSIPIVGLILMGLFIGHNFYGDAQTTAGELRQLSHFNQTMLSIGRYVDSLQRERIYANAYLASARQEKYLQKFQSQAAITDSLESALLETLQALQQELALSPDEFTKPFTQNREKVTGVRNEIAAGTAKLSNLFIIYNKTADTLHFIGDRMQQEIKNGQLAYLFGGYIGLNHLKEKLAVDDALHIGVFLKDASSEEERRLIEANTQLRNFHLNAFRSKAPPEVFRCYLDDSEKPVNDTKEVHAQIALIRKNLYSKNSGFSQNADDYYTLTQRKWAAMTTAQEYYSQVFLSQASAASHSNQRGFYVALGTITSLALLTLGACFWSAAHIQKTLRTISDELAHSTTTSVDAVKEVSSASDELTTLASSSAASIEEISASLVEISSMVGVSGEGSQRARQSSAKTRTAVEEGLNQVNILSQSVEEMKHTSNRIAKIIQSIDEIAFQTNILALNAAVEAARAGEAGAGFAVVAEEVRALAQRSAKAAHETAEIVREHSVKTAAGTTVAAAVCTLFKEIASQITVVDQQVDEINRSTHEQGNGIRQITTAVQNQDQGAQKLATAASSLAEHSVALAHQMTAIKANLDKLEILSGHSTP